MKRSETKEGHRRCGASPRAEGRDEGPLCWKVIFFSGEEKGGGYIRRETAPEGPQAGKED